MKQTFTTLSIIVFFSINIASFAQSKVAVLNTSDKNNTNFGLAIREMLSSGLSKSEYCKPVAQVSIDKITKENNQLANDNNVIEIGAQLGVDLVCVSMIQRMGSNFFISAKLVNVKKGTVDFQEYTRTEKGEEDLFEKVDILAKMLSNVELNSCAIEGSVIDSLVIVEIDFLDYMVMPKDFDNEMEYTDAKNACSDIIAFGYDDWFLPTKEQLNGIYLNKEIIGGLDTVVYWSVSSVSPNAYAQHFGTGEQQSESRRKELSVRCIRRNY